MKHSKYPKIGQFRNTIIDVRMSSRFIGLDDKGEAMYDETRALPSLMFHGTIKLHGTNAAVCYTYGGVYGYTGEDEKLYAQSRTNIITSQNDNAGFAFFVESHYELLKDMVLRTTDYILAPENTICVYGEWCGGGIQKGVAINQLEKMFVIFGVKIIIPEKDSEWLDLESVYIDLFYHDREYMKELNDNRVFFINQFPQYNLEIDFAKPEMSQNKFVEFTTEVANECPVAKYFGVSGLGEGIVWEHKSDLGHYKFKVKDERHSASKIKKLAMKDPEKMESIDKFVEYAATENRFKQSIEQVFTSQGKEVDIKGMGDFIRWIMNDIIAEESDTMVANKLIPKDVGKFVSNEARKWFFKNYR